MLIGSLTEFKLRSALMLQICMSQDLKGPQPYLYILKLFNAYSTSAIDLYGPNITEVRRLRLKLHMPTCGNVKGSVQRKLRWVETGVNRWAWASDRGAGKYFIVKVSLHLVLSLFPFQVSTTQFIGELWNNRWSGVSVLAPVLLALHRKKYWRCDAPCAYRRSGAHSPRL
jgi:hypothetical protein